MGASLKFTSIHAISIFFPKSAIFALSSCIYLVSEPNLASYDSSPDRPHLRDALTTHRGHLLVACIVRTLLLIVQPKTQLSSSTLSIQALFPTKPEIRPFSDPTLSPSSSPVIVAYRLRRRQPHHRKPNTIGVVNNDLSSLSLWRRLFTSTARYLQSIGQKRGPDLSRRP